MNYEGGISYSEVWEMSHYQRDIAIKELVKKSDAIKSSQGISTQKQF